VPKVALVPCSASRMSPARESLHFRFLDARLGAVRPAACWPLVLKGVQGASSASAARGDGLLGPAASLQRLVKMRTRALQLSDVRSLC
jgi:hypothetical protein